MRGSTATTRPGAAVVQQGGFRLHPAAIAAGLLVGALACLVLPVVPILLGVLLTVTVGVHVWAPELRPYLERVLHLPVARASRRRTQLVGLAAAGIALVVCGSFGATLRGRVNSRIEEAERRQQSVDADVGELLERARTHLKAGQVDDAELALLDARAIGSADSSHDSDVAELLERVQRANNAGGILSALVRMPADELAAFENRASVPAELEFPERSLTARAVHLANEQLAEAHRRRALR